MRGVVHRTLIVGALVSGVLIACGDSVHPSLLGDYYPTKGDGGAAPGSLVGGGDASTQPSKCGTLSDGGACGCEDIPLFGDPPNMYFVLDRSGSMAEDDKWDTVRDTVADVIKAIGPRANFGAAIFPASSDVDECATGVEVMPVRPGDPPSANNADGPTTTALLLATQLAAGGGTPTSSTLNAILPTLAVLPGKTFVVLATDGGPNCNDNATCDASSCVPNIENEQGCPATVNCCASPVGTPANCLDTSATVAAVAALASINIPTYVIGIPGSGPYAAVLNALATAGGTAQAGATQYYAVDTTDEDDLEAALKKVAAKVTATCTLTLNGTPDPGEVNVYFDQVVVPQDAVNGWTISGNTVTLVGTSCQEMLDGDVLDVRVIAGCPTVVK